MQAQIEDFISKQGQAPADTTASTAPSEASVQSTPAEEPATTASPVMQPEEQTQSEQPQLATPTPTPTSILPTTPQPAPTPEESDNGVEDNVSIAHKKVIQPPVEPIQTKPDLSELLAREGISSLDDDAHTNDEIITPGGAAPHQPGHVISPSGTVTTPQTNSLNPDDPNNIAL